METLYNLTVRRQTSNKLVAGTSFRAIAGKFTLLSIPVFRTGYSQLIPTNPMHSNIQGPADEVFKVNH